MTGATTTQGFLNLLEESAVRSPEVLERVRQLVNADMELRLAARLLIKEKIVTLWQAKQLAAGCTALKFGRYELLDELGHSELGRVYLAEHGPLKRRVALKILSRRLTANPDAVSRFLAESRVLSSLDNRNLIHVFDVGQESDRYYLVLEYVTGRNATQIVAEEGPLAVDRATRLIAQATAGLAVAHAKGVVHGGLKPENLLLDDQGTIKVLGLGIAQLGGRLAPPEAIPDDTDGDTATAVIDKLYQAPEVASGEPATPASDLYSIGAIWYLLLTGALPVAAGPGQDAQSGARQRLQTEGCVASEVQELVVGLLATDPAQRGASIESLCQAIDKWLATQPAPAPPLKPLAASNETAAGGTVGEGKPAAKKVLLRARSLERPVATDAEMQATGESPAETAEEAPEPLFQIRTTSRGRGKGASKATTAVGESGFHPKSRAARRRLMIIVGTCLAAGVVVLLGAIGVWALNWSQSSTTPLRPFTPQVADKDGPTNDGSQASDQTNASTDNAVATNAADVNVAAKPNETPEPDPTGKGESTAKPETKPDSTAKPDTTPKPESTPKPDVPKPEAPKPEAPKPEAPKPEPPAKPDPDPKPSPKPAAAEPFKDVPKVVDLPPIEKEGGANQPVALGKLAVDSKAICIVHLLGGAGVLRGKQKFALEAAENGTAQRDWEIFLKDGAASATGTKIAHVSLKDETLSFQWTNEASGEPNAAALANCVLNLATGPKSHAMALRKVIVAEPMKVDLIKGGNGKWEIPNGPDPNKVQLEFTLEGGFPAHKVEGAQPLSGDKGSLAFAFQMGDKPEDFKVLAIKLEVASRKFVTAAATVWIKPYYSPKPERLTPTALKKAQVNTFSTQQTLFNQLESMKKANPQDEASKLTMALKGEQHTAAQRGLAQLEQVRLLIESIGETGRIHVRAYYMADDKRVELLTTGGPEPAPKP